MMHYPRISLYALMLATASIPLYIHLPRFAAVQLEISLGALGGVLLLLRVMDFAQDPLLGWLTDRWPGAQPVLAVIASVGLAVGFPLLFSLGPGGVWPMIALLVLIFTCYSLGAILIYGRSEVLARNAEPGELLTLAIWREAGQLTGVIIAAATPSVLLLAGAGDQAYPAFGLLLAGIALAATWFSYPVWRRIPAPGIGLSLPRLSSSGALRLLCLALLNALPVALTSTLFLFFAEDHLGLSGQAGLFLLVFFLSAGLGVPFWALVSKRLGNRQTLIVAMSLAVVTFAGAAFRRAAGRHRVSADLHRFGFCDRGGHSDPAADVFKGADRCGAECVLCLRVLEPGGKTCPCPVRRHRSAPAGGRRFHPRRAPDTCRQRLP